MQQAPGLVDVLADLDVIGRVESMGQARGIDSLEQVADARGRVSIDSLLVLEQQRHAPALGPPRQLLHPGDDLVAVSRGVVAGRDVKAEDPDPGRLVEVREVQGPAESQEMIVERLGDPYLANRRAQGAEAKASRPQQTPIGLVLLVVEIQHVGPMDGPKLDVPDPVPGQNVDLLQGVLGNLVGESTEANHRVLLIGRRNGILADDRHDSSSRKNRQRPVETAACFPVRYEGIG